MSLSSYSKCNGHDLVLPDLPQLPAAVVADMLTRVDVGAEAPTPALGKMAVAAIFATRCAKLQRKDTACCCCCCCLVSDEN